MDAISETRLGEVHPSLAAPIRQMADRLALENIVIRVTQGLRTWTQQQSLYDHGRDAAGNTIGSVITNAKAGYSWHNFALAVDVAPFDKGIPDWNVGHPAWGRIVAVGISLGLVAGAEWRTFPDWPHFQLSSIPVTPTDEDRQLFTDGGQQAVWEHYLL